MVSWWLSLKSLRIAHRTFDKWFFIKNRNEFLQLCCFSFFLSLSTIQTLFTRACVCVLECCVCVWVGDEGGNGEESVFVVLAPLGQGKLNICHARRTRSISLYHSVLVWHGLFSLAIKSKFFLWFRLSFSFYFAHAFGFVLFCFCRRLSNSFAISDRIEFDHLPRIVDGVISCEYRMNIVCTILRGSSIIFSLLIGIRFVNLVRETRMRTSLGNLVESARRRDLLSMRHERSARASK